MATEISEESKVTLDLKTIGIIIGFTISLATTYFTLKADIVEAKELPVPEVTEVEFGFKDQLTRKIIEKLEVDVNGIKADVVEVKESLNKIDERLYEISKKVK